MNTCLLDLGNTRFKWILRKNLGKGSVRRASYVQGNSVETVIDALSRGPAFDRLLVSSVRSNAFNAALQLRYPQKIQMIRITDTHLMPLAYKETSQFGIDRYLAALGAREHYPLPLIVVDAGTAVTFDVIDADGAHRGGCIFPGLQLLRKSLLSGTDGVEDINSIGAQLLAKSTAEGVAAGTVTGYGAGVEGVIQALQASMQGQANVILTGGDAELLQECLMIPAPVDPLLIFHGMNLIDSESL